MKVVLFGTAVVLALGACGSSSPGTVGAAFATRLTERIKSTCGASPDVATTSGK